MVSDARLERDNLSSRSQLFMVRVWLEDLGEGKTEWRGKVQCVASGEVHYFRGCQNLISDLQAMLLPSESVNRTEKG